ncbi:MAG: SRPBCC family protein [Nostocoides sp.]
MSPSNVVPLIEATIDVAASPQRVWAVVADPVALGRLSPQVLRTVVLGRAPVRVGTIMVNLNRAGMTIWPTRAVVTEFEPVRRFSFTVTDNRATWSLTLTPTPTGTHIVHRREMTRGTTAVSGWIIDIAGGGQERYAALMRKGMQATLSAVADLVR